MTGHVEDKATKTAISAGATINPPDDEGLEDIEIVYRAIKQSVISWQAENSGKLAAWRPAALHPTDSTNPDTSCDPFGVSNILKFRLMALRSTGEQRVDDRRTSIFTLAELPDILVLQLWQHLNTRFGIQSSLQDLEEQFGLFKETGTLADEEMLTRLYMAISGVAGLARRQFSPQELEASTEGWEESLCPVCGEATHLALILPPAGKRHLFCRVCGHEWPVKRVGCILCGSEEAKKQIYLHSESYPGVEMVVCETCGESFKEFDLRERACQDYVWEDIRTLPLNYAAKQWLEQQAGRIPES